MRIVTDILELAGAAFVVLGVFLIHVPAGFIALGLALGAVGYLADAPAAPADEPAPGGPDPDRSDL